MTISEPSNDAALQATSAKQPSGRALAGILVGGAGVFWGLAPFFGALLGITALVLGVLALRGGQPKRMVVAALILGGIATLSSTWITVEVLRAVNFR